MFSASKRMIVYAILLFLPITFSSLSAKNKADNGLIRGAYIMGIGDDIPDPNLVSHVFFAFGHVNKTFDGVYVPDTKGLSKVTALKNDNKHLKVLLSVGGWGSGRFSEMAASSELRKSFALSCLNLVKEFNLDGIDIDWEYPTSNSAGISSSPDDTRNFTLLLKELRRVLGHRRLLTIASACDAKYIDFKSVVKYLDYVNIMAYDMGGSTRHHASLRRSKYSGYFTVEEALNAHEAAGVKPSQILLGMPFYGRGNKKYGSFTRKAPVLKDEDFEIWDPVGQVPLVVDKDSVMQYGFENQRSIAAKCEFIKSRGLAGGMYWEYNQDLPGHILAKTVSSILAPNAASVEGIASKKVSETKKTTSERPASYAKAPRFKALLLWEPNAESAHVDFAKQTMTFFHKLSYGEGFILDYATSLSKMTYEKLSEYSVLICVNAQPNDDYSRKLFEKYMTNGGGWVGFHAACYNDSRTNWPWFLDFIGGGVFKCNNWPPQPALLQIDSRKSPVTRNLPKTFVIPPSEFYQWSPDPSNNKDIKVLASLSKLNYPLGIKDIVFGGKFPIVWTNTKYRMIYLNMGHGDEEYIDANQQLLFLNAFRWVVSTDPKGNPFN